ncbi:MAG TPA: hypothetical protein VK858_07270 [Longimicrobiales bacterium]|nr:hypothetical protein [Longimicrobiales bacterium]
MRFLSMIRIEETDQKPSERLLEEMGKLVGEMIRDGNAYRLPCVPGGLPAPGKR